MDAATVLAISMLLLPCHSMPLGLGGHTSAVCTQSRHDFRGMRLTNIDVGTACRATFTVNSLEVRVVALQGKNYVYAVKSLFMPVNVDGCHVAASKTKKNVLITLQVQRQAWRRLLCCLPA